jgi:hypothetical protein
MKGLNVQNWLDQTILKIRQYSDRPILVRMHPGDKKIKQTLKINHRNVTVSPQERPLTVDLKNAFAKSTKINDGDRAAAVRSLIDERYCEDIIDVLVNMKNYINKHKK